MKFIEKVIVAVVSSLILSLSLAFLVYVPVDEQQAGVGYHSLTSLFIIYLIYSLPVYLIGGGLYSALADVYLNSKRFRNKFIKYITGLFVYGLGGLLIIGLILLIESNNSGLIMFNTLIFGALAALLFFHISILWRVGAAFLRERR